MIKVDKISNRDVLIYYTRYEASSGVNIVLQEVVVLQKKTKNPPKKQNTKTKLN